MSRKSPDRVSRNFRERLLSLVKKFSSKSERDPQDDKSTKKVKSGDLSRRDFLKLGGITVAAAGTAALALEGERSSAINIHQPIELRNLSEEEALVQNKINEIYEYRRKLGLKGSIWSEDVNQDEKEWGEPGDTEIIVDVPRHMLSYGLRVKEITEKILGNKASLFVRIIKQDKGYTFNYSDRKLTLTGEVRTHHPTLQHALGVTLHEAIGHGTDTVGFTEAGIQIPFKDLVSIEHGKWRALSQAFSVSGEFFDHPGDGMLATIKTPLSEEIARILFFRYSSLSDNAEINQEVERIVEEVRIKQGVQGETYFNKAFCAEMGELLFERIFSDPQKINQLHPGIQRVYQQLMQNALHEIYAEMVRLSLEPDQAFAPNNNLILVQGNADISEGIKEVLEAITGASVDMVRLRNSLQNISSNLRDLHALEGITEELIANSQTNADVVTATSSAPTISTEEEIESDSIHLDKESLINNLIESFYRGDFLSSYAYISLGPDELDYVGEYVNWSQRLLKSHPSYNITSQESRDTSHTQNLESDIFQYAVGQNFVRGLITTIVEKRDFISETDLNYFDELRWRINAIQAFLTSREEPQESSYEYLSELNKDQLTDELIVLFNRGDLFSSGKTDYLTEEEKNALSDYATWTQRLTELYPTINHPNQDWDHPRMHIWDSKALLIAIEPNYVRRIMTEIAERRHFSESGGNFIPSMIARLNLIKDFFELTGLFAKYPTDIYSVEIEQ